MYVLRFAELVETFLAQFTRMARLAHSSERTGIIIRKRVIDPECPGGDAIHSFHGRFHLVGVAVGSQTIRPIICKFDAFIDIADAHDGKHGSERFRANEPHVLPDIYHDRWLIKISFIELWRPAAAGQDAGTLLNGFFDSRMNIRELTHIDERADVRVGFHSVADFERSSEVDHTLREFISDGFEHVETFRTCTYLTCV